MASFVIGFDREQPGAGDGFANSWKKIISRW